MLAAPRRQVTLAVSCHIRDQVDAEDGDHNDDERRDRMFGIQDDIVDDQLERFGERKRPGSAEYAEKERQGQAKPVWARIA